MGTTKPVTGHRRAVGIVSVALALVMVLVPLTSCKNADASAATPPPPMPRPARTQPQPPAGPVSEPQTVATLPSPQPVPPGAVPETPGPLVNQPRETANQQPAPAPPRPQTTAPPVTSEAPPQQETPAASVPQLGQILSGNQRQRYTLLIDEAIRKVQERLEVVSANSSKLNVEQHTTLKRIRAFVKQAQDARDQEDLVIAKNLADRAVTLADDLAKNFK